MASIDAMADHPKFTAFSITHHVYKTVDSIDIPLSILVPKNPTPRTNGLPVLLRFHGGGLFLGERIFPDWFSSWIIEYATSKSAIIVCPDYRLLPEVKALDILEDVRDAVRWLDTDLNRVLEPTGVRADTSQTLLAGESAGAYLAVQAALRQASAPLSVRFRAVVALYGMLDLKHQWFTKKYDKYLMGTPPLPVDVPDKIASEAKAGRAPKFATSAGGGSERVQAFMSSIQHGRFLEFAGEEDEIFIVENLDKLETPIWMAHGRDDSVVPVDNSLHVAWKLAQKSRDAKYFLTLENGDHGFDTESRIDTPWVKDGLAFLNKFWVHDE